MQTARSAAKPLVDFSNTRVAFEGKTTAQLLRAWAVFRVSNVRPIVANASSLLRASYSVLGKGITNAVLRQTFFGHFCGGVDGEDIQPTIRALRQRGVGSILDYAAEADVQTVAPKEHGISRHKLTARIYDYEGEDMCDANAEICMRAIEVRHRARADARRGSRGSADARFPSRAFVGTAFGPGHARAIALS